MSRVVTVPAAAVLVLVAASCARLDYVKVPSPTQYAKWSDDDQRKADEMQGVRYYLPRPFVHLKQSVPVAQRVAFVGFKLNDTKTLYQLDLPREAPTWLRRVLPSSISFVQALALTAEGAPAETKKGGLESGTPAETKSAVEPSAPPSTLKARNGFINDTDPVTRLSDLMDVVYLPDFDEQYVIQPSGGLGTVDIETRLRNGWAAEVFAQQVDNSNLIPYVIEQVENASSVAAGIATTWGLKIATGGAAPAGLANALGAKLESTSPEEVANAKKKALDLLGESLAFKIVEVRVAQPGLYPILKPREMHDWLKVTPLVAGSDPQRAFELFLQQANLPWIRPDMAFIPCPPFTMIGFNATTDVYLAPVTDRVRLEATSTSTVTEAGNAGSEAKIVAALKAAAAALQESVVKAFVGGGEGIQAGVGPAPNKTKIRVGKKSGNTAPAPEAANSGEIVAWLKAALPGLTDAQVEEPTYSPNAFEVVVSRSPGDLAGLVK